MVTVAGEERVDGSRRLSLSVAKDHLMADNPLGLHSWGQQRAEISGHTRLLVGVERTADNF